MKRRRIDPRDDRRRQRVEINLLGEGHDSPRQGSRVRRGCTLPFTGGLLILVLSVIELTRAILG